MSLFFMESIYFALTWYILFYFSNKYWDMKSFFVCPRTYAVYYALSTTKWLMYCLYSRRHCKLVKKQNKTQTPLIQLNNACIANEIDVSTLKCLAHTNWTSAQGEVGQWIVWSLQTKSTNQNDLSAYACFPILTCYRVWEKHQSQSWEEVESGRLNENTCILILCWLAYTLCIANKGFVN